MLSPYLAMLEADALPLLRTWLGLSDAVSLRFLTHGPRVESKPLRVALEGEGRSLTLLLEEAAPDAKWRRDGWQVTCVRPDGEFSARDPVIAGWLRHLARRFGEPAGRASDGGALFETLEHLRLFHAEGIDDSQLRRLETATHGMRGFLRIGHRCNQDCTICPQGRHWPSAPEPQVFRWLDELAAVGVRHLTLSGGEPTIYPWLARLVERAAGTHGMRVLLQTNAVQFAKKRVLRRLTDAGLEYAFVSFHSADEDVSDQLTRAPGTHRRTVEGIRNALDAGLWVGLNCCVDASTVDGLEAHARFIVAQFVTPRAHNPVAHVEYSQPGAYYDEASMERAMVSLDRVRAPLVEALRVLRDAGVHADCLGTCGFPPCLLRDDPSLVSWRLAGRLDAHDRSARCHPAACDGCAARDYCVGVRREYRVLHGSRGLVAFSAMPDAVEALEVDPEP